MFTRFITMPISLTLVWITLVSPAVFAQQEPGVELFHGPRFQGKSATFHTTLDNLQDHPIGRGRVGSIRVPAGITVTLYSRPYFQGNAVTLHRDTEKLHKNGVSSVGSIRIQRVNDRAYIGAREANGRNAGRADVPSVPTRGVVLYQQANFQGREQVFRNSEANLADTHLGVGVMGSIRIEPGYVVTLFTGPNFRGSSEKLTADDADLSNNRVASKPICSIQVTHQASPRPTGVTLYEHENFRGRSQSFLGDVRDLGSTNFGNDRLTSVAVPPGYTVTLFEHPNFRGRSETLRSDDTNLSDNSIGNDQVSSIRVEREAPSRPRGTVKLFRNKNYQGSSLKVRRDIHDLNGTQVGNDELSSLQIPPGWEVVLFRDADYQGDYEVFTRSVADLKNTQIGNDTVTSVQVRWIGH